MSRSNRADGERLSGLQRLDRAQVRPLLGEFREDLLTAAIAQFVVVIVQTQPGRRDRVVADDPSEPGLDEVVELGVGGADGLVDGRSRQRLVIDASGRGQEVTSVSARAACVAAMVVSMSSAVTP